MPLLITFPTFSPPQALKMVGSFVGGGARKKVAGTLQNCKNMRPITITLESSAPSRSSLFTASSASNRPPQQPTPPRRNRLHHHTAKPTAAIPPAFAAFAIAIAALSPPSASPLPPLPPLPRRHHRNRYRRRRRQARRRRPHRPHLTRPRPRCARHHSARHCRPRHRRPRRHLTRHAPPPPHPTPAAVITIHLLSPCRRRTAAGPATASAPSPPAPSPRLPSPSPPTPPPPSPPLTRRRHHHPRSQNPSGAPKPLWDRGWSRGAFSHENGLEECKILNCFPLRGRVTYRPLVNTPPPWPESRVSSVGRSTGSSSPIEKIVI